MRLEPHIFMYIAVMQFIFNRSAFAAEFFVFLHLNCSHGSVHLCRFILYGLEQLINLAIFGRPHLKSLSSLVRPILLQPIFVHGDCMVVCNGFDKHLKLIIGRGVYKHLSIVLIY